MKARFILLAVQVLLIVFFLQAAAGRGLSWTDGGV